MSDESPKTPEFEEGFVEIPVSYEELFAVIRILEHSRAAFEHLAKEAEAHSDAQLVDTFRARADLCKIFADKFHAVAKVGQPSDDSKH
jgi:hypothetical protein